MVKRCLGSFDSLADWERPEERGSEQEAQALVLRALVACPPRVFEGAAERRFGLVCPAADPGDPGEDGPRSRLPSLVSESGKDPDRSLDCNDEGVRVHVGV